MNGPQDGVGDNIWQRLRRRKVVQWGIAYAAGAWGLLQVLQFLADTYDWPAQVLRLVTLAFAIGLPIALTLAWYHGDRGHQKPVRAELAIIALLLVLGGGALWVYSHRSAPAPTVTTSSTAAPGPAATTAPADARPSIAVLPFENRSDEQKDAFFVDGVHDDILTQLTKIGAMKVIARTSVEQFRDTKLSTKEIGERLGVTRVLEGSVQRANDRVRVTAQLIDTASDAHLWAESYDRELTAANIFAIQSEVATSIAAALETTLTAAEKARVDIVPTRNLAAWEAFQLGRQRMARRTAETLSDAERFFQKAIDLDPEFALAYVGLSDSLTLQIEHAGAQEDVNLARADAAVATALELDPNLAEAWASSALIRSFRGQLDRADPLYRRSIALNPNYAAAYQRFSRNAGGLGHRDEALAAAEKAVELDPLSAIVNADLGRALVSVGRFDEAADRFRKANEIDPEMPMPYRQAGVLDAYARNRFADAVPLLQRAAALDPENPLLEYFLARLYFDLGDDVAAIRVIEAARKRWPGHAAVLMVSAEMHMNTGEWGAALKDTQRLLALDSWTGDPDAVLRWLRDADLKQGNHQAARLRYAKAYPVLLASTSPMIDGSNWQAAIDVAPVLRAAGEDAAAGALLDRAEQVVRTVPRLGVRGYGIADAQIHALRGDNAKALAALREAARAGWRGPYWRYYRDFDPCLASIRNTPEFKAVFADIERDMARQRAELAARPTDAPISLAASPRRP
ncbi:MAG: tetratricopeptide repeat protein [Steroidobacteraceae bacterium]